MDAAVPATESEPLSITKTVRSEELPELARLLRHFQQLDPADVYQFDVILDANVIMPELRWAALKRRNPAARSNLHELLECATVRAYAPTFLKDEVAVNLPEIATAEKIPLEKMQAQWEILQRLIRFVDVGGPDPGADLADSKDVPYLRLQHKLSLPIATDDPHLTVMGATVIRVQLLAPLRTYSRYRAVEFKLEVAGVGTLMLATLLLEALAAALLRTARSIPRPLLILAGVVLLFALLHPESRKKLFAVATGILEGATHAIGGCAALLRPLMDEHTAATKTASTALTEAHVALPGHLRIAVPKTKSRARQRPRKIRTQVVQPA